MEKVDILFLKLNPYVLLQTSYAQQIRSELMIHSFISTETANPEVCISEGALISHQDLCQINTLISLKIPL